MKEDTTVRQPPPCLPGASQLRAVLVQCWSRLMSSVWSPETASRGQCGVTALVLQDQFGGEILKTRVGQSWHFYNRIAGLRLDATADQCSAPVEYLDILSSREEAFTDTTQAQYEELSRRFAATQPPDRAERAH